VLVIGAGLGGLNAAIQLKKAGLILKLLDKNPGVGVLHQNDTGRAGRYTQPCIFPHRAIGLPDFDHLFRAAEGESEIYQLAG